MGDGGNQARLGHRGRNKFQTGSQDLKVLYDEKEEGTATHADSGPRLAPRKGALPAATSRHRTESLGQRHHALATRGKIANRRGRFPREQKGKTESEESIDSMGTTSNKKENIWLVNTGGRQRSFLGFGRAIHREVARHDSLMNEEAPRGINSIPTAGQVHPRKRYQVLC